MFDAARSIKRKDLLYAIGAGAGLFILKYAAETIGGFGGGPTNHGLGVVGFDQDAGDRGRLGIHDGGDGERADQGGLDVQNGRIDLLLIDAEPAIDLAEQLGLKILLITNSTTTAGKAIALPEGETALKAELDTIIQGLIDDGTMVEIEEANALPNLD